MALARLNCQPIATTPTARMRQDFNPAPSALRDYQRTYEQANHPPLATAQGVVRAGRFSAALEIPSAAVGRCRIRAFVAGASDCAAGWTTIEIRQSE